ncbi:hypothetical protein ACN23B_06895 [Anabaena sp. FACHB-709]|uniref:Uncharacterized protein n=2 Tax=Nostocaceae TaxID=1162 RepID=A0A1Z4KTJ0_ANAVA|nr:MULTISPECIES: hypothetical protein [Nostocaceae]BAY72355.1 hypothetical protein NIES23_51800 [Trichormus variabilis NIES-23]HBW32167.1 hypothetical protein [Nostoc sp. UBA8866]MBD2170743.1 hypothetical protein [Anabaena cylindrica FACHB-318]MBD2262529.1 hypothetical protein [Anabaena sp. FACHB-709]MBD2272076.1 hypothetical protein [Nostoc sp. PCC 7120 = FACHB-418]
MFYFPGELFLQAYSLPLIAEVRPQRDYFIEYPQQIPVGTKASVFYNRQSGYYAAHYKQASTIPSQAILILNEGEGAIAIFSGEPDATIQNIGNTDTLSPVYTLENNGTLTVPTGLVFIRFTEGVDIESQQAAINQAGYEVAKTLAYAPNAGWLRAKTNKIADALKGIAQLSAIKNVENVEPQMLIERQLREK